MKLTDLDPHWVGAGGEGISDKDGNSVPRREGVAITFDCPCGCGQPTILHLRNPLDGGPPIESRSSWERTGDTFETLTLRPSIQRMNGCRWHGYITNGEAKAV